jgi:hypothetical protein
MTVTGINGSSIEALMLLMPLTPMPFMMFMAPMGAVYFTGANF